jgi:hypothetical protein
MSQENNSPETVNFTLECQQMLLELTYMPSKVIEDLAEGFGCQISEIPSDLLGGIFKAMFGNCKRLKKKRGGARKRNNIWLETDEECAQFAELVDGLRPLWTYLIQFFEWAGFDSDNEDAVKGTAKYKALSVSVKEVPKKLINEARRREALKESGRKIPPQIQPRGLALAHAAHELGFADKLKYETLKKRYGRGKRALGLNTSELSLQP